MGTCVFQARPSGPLEKVANGDICCFSQKETGAKSVAMATT